MTIEILEGLIIVIPGLIDHPGKKWTTKIMDLLILRVGFINTSLNPKKAGVFYPNRSSI